MTTLRSSVLLDHNASTVWDVIRDTSNISRWFPGITTSVGNTRQRTVVLGDGSTIVEDIVTLDDTLRRMQYRAVGGDLPIESHLGTVDVFEIGEGRTLLSYSTEIEPADLAAAFHTAIDEAVENLPDHLSAE
ncbi:SRPBCC family protein [Gordonia sp. NPDC003376]